MEAKITSYRTLQIYPSEYNKDEKVAETIFIEDILKLKNEGDSVLLTRKNASGLSCLAYLESRPVEKLVMPKIAGLDDLKKLYKDLCKQSDTYRQTAMAHREDELKEIYENRNIGITEAIKWLRNFIIKYNSNFTA